jgi:ABC-type polysaccharide/polyol phosphate transport system ATPase subunit
MSAVVRAKNLSKAFALDPERVTLFRAVTEMLFPRAPRPNPFFALKDINLEIGQGEKVGLIGNNGSGKTTLLKVIAGIHKPDEGKVTLLAGLGIGLVDELSVRENVFLYGAIYGLDRKTVREEFSDIIEWAEVQDFVEARLKTLSSGMRTRLAFSIARQIETDVLLLDEALTAGDKTFTGKCAEFFEQSRTNDTTFMVATHDLHFVRKFCTKTLWLHKGRQRAFGETAEVVNLYLNSERE